MGFKPGDEYTELFTTERVDTGVITDADSTPTATAYKNGSSDGSFNLTVTELTTGVYKVTGTVPTGYISGDVFQVLIEATVNSVDGGSFLYPWVVDTKRNSDIEPSVNSTVQASPTPTTTSCKGSGLSSSYDFYTNALAVFKSGTLSGAAFKITGYTTSTQVLTFTTALPLAPSSGDIMEIVGRIS